MKENSLAEMIVKSDRQIINIRKSIIAGDNNLLSAYNRALSQLLNNPIDHGRAYSQINALCNSAQPTIIIELNNEIFPKVAAKHTRKDLDKFIIHWRKNFYGSGSRLNYPNIASTLQAVKVGVEDKSSVEEFLHSNKEFEKNMLKIEEKKVQFFQDEDGDSFLSESMDGDTFLDIIEMNVEEIKEIRKVVESGPIDQAQGEEYYKKMKNFLSLRPRTLKKELDLDFNSQKIWAKQYIECYNEYYSKGGSGQLNMHAKLGSGKNIIESSKQIPKRPSQQIISHGNIYFKDNEQEIIKYEQTNRISYNQTRKVASYERMTYEPQKQKGSVLQKVESKHLPTAKFIQSGTQKQILSLEVQQLQVSQAYRPSKMPYRGSLPINNKQISSKDIKLNDENYPISQSQYQPIKAKQDIYTGPNFILDPEQIRNEPRSPTYNDPVNLVESRTSKRSRIFGNKNRVITEEAEPGEEDLVVYKHQAIADPYYPKVNVHLGQKQKPIMRHTLNEYQDSYGSADRQFLLSDQMTPINQKSSRTAQSPNTAFPSRNLNATSSSKKLSQFTQQKRQRRMVAPIESLSPIEDYVMNPYSQNFDNVVNFARFRRNCLEDNFTLYASSFLMVSCVMIRESDSRVKIEIVYQNQSHTNLALESVYKVPKCFKIEKCSKINKRFTLYDQVQHIFILELTSFPLEACILNLKYTIQANAEDIRHQNPTQIVIPLTMRNFLEYLMLGDDEWRKFWAKWSENRNFSLTKHIILDRLVANDDNIELALKQFTPIPGIQGYSVQQFGAFCRHLSSNNLKFLLRISLRVDNIMSLEILTDKKINEPDESDFLEYCLNVWSMLLSKVLDNLVE